MAKLIHKDDKTGEMREYPLKPNRTTVGRLPTLDVYLEHDSVSREHAEIQCIDDAYILIDKRSLNGVYLNTKRVTKATLHEGDQVVFGKVPCVFSLAPCEHAFEQSFFSNTFGKVLSSVQDQFSGLDRQVSSFLGIFADKPAKDKAELENTIMATLKKRTHRFEQAYRQLSILYRTSQWINLDLDLENVLAACLDQVIAALKMDRGFLFVYHPGRDELDVLGAREVRDEDGAGSRRFSMIRSIARRVYETREGIAFTPSYKTPNTAFLTQAASAYAILCVPVIGTKKDCRGVLYFDCQASDVPYSRGEMDFLATFASQAALALERDSLIEEVIAKREMEREVGIAREIQERLLPKTVPSSVHFCVAGRSVPSRSVGGDYFDFAMADDGTDALRMIVADVSGKGIPAALVLSETRSILKVYTREHFPPRDILGRLNENLLGDFEGSMYVTLVYCTFDWKSGVLRYANAGHEWPMLVTDTAEKITYLDRSSRPCGLFEEDDWEEIDVKLKDGDKIIFPTDGIIDAENDQGEKFSIERLEETVLKFKTLPCQELLDSVFNEVQEFSGDGPQFDDMTLVVVEVKDLSTKTGEAEPTAPPA